MTRQQREGGALAPVEKVLVVRGEPERVFRRFTREMGRWWPVRTHSVSGEAEASVVFEEREGGRVFERTGAGAEHDWGAVRVWDPPRRFVMSWHPGRGAGTAQEVEVRFAAAGEGRTRLELIHRGWEALGAGAEETRGAYGPGWDHVLGIFQAHAG